MYFPLEINEQLANAMRAAAKAKAEINIFMESEKARDVKRVDLHFVNELDEILCNVVCQIANLSGCVIAAEVIKDCNDCAEDANKTSASTPTLDTEKSTKAYICDVISGLVERINTLSKEDVEFYKRAICVLCDYKRLVDELSKVKA